MRRVERAVVSVYDKTGIIDFARGLHRFGAHIISSGGTARMLEDARIPVQLASEYTGFPEILEGRVKTLHPKIYGGILARRDDDDHVRQLAEWEIPSLDMVVVNLYPFEQWIEEGGRAEEEMIEMIDIGGPAMIRAAAKNHSSVAVITDPKQYGAILKELGKNSGALSSETRARLAAEAFCHTAHYDSVIANYFMNRRESSPFPFFFEKRFEKVGDLRYGENPHQRGAVYRDVGVHEAAFIGASKLSGKELSFNNYLDTHAAVECVWEFEAPAVAVIKHTNPCGAACGSSVTEAYEKAYAGDPLSAFGSVVGFNRPVDVETARRMATPNTFFEVIVAPYYEEGALPLLTEKRWWGKTVRILQYEPGKRVRNADPVMSQILGGLLLQEKDVRILAESDLRTVTQREPTDAEREALRFAWTIVKHVKSNAILLAQGDMVVGVGAGQMSRVDSSSIAVRKAGERARGAVLASDAFFPFRDALDVAGEAGVTAAIQPGGSKGDENVIAAANEHGMAMVFTGMRHFRHL